MVSRSVVGVAVALLALVTATHALKCDDCWGGTDGPCQHDLDMSCLEYTPGSPGVCSPGTTACGAIDCVVSDWTKWSDCDKECDGGFQTRTRKITVAAAHGGAKCPVLTETRACNTDKCGTFDG